MDLFLLIALWPVGLHATHSVLGKISEGRGIDTWSNFVEDPVVWDQCANDDGG